MKTTYILPAAIIGLALANPVFADDVKSEVQTKTTVEKDADGNYQRKTTRSAESTDSAGTTTKSETKIEAESDSDGDVSRTVTTETSNDPKGLMNKTKTKTTDSVKYEDGKVESKHQKKVNGKTVEEHTETSKR